MSLRTELDNLHIYLFCQFFSLLRNFQRWHLSVTKKKEGEGGGSFLNLMCSKAVVSGFLLA